MSSREFDLPPYSYVPGMFPHPISDPQGHGFQVLPVEGQVTESGWRECEPYLQGMTLFNHGYYWEAHECWEAVWQATGRHGVQADFLKALIKLAAALVKAREGRVAGVSRHAERAETLLTKTFELGGGATYMGLSLPTLIAASRQLKHSPADFINTSRVPVLNISPLRLLPAGKSE